MTDRTAARLIGVLFIVASVAAIAGGMLILPVEEAETLAEVAAGDAGIVSGVLLEAVMVLAVVGIAALFFTVFRRREPGLAMVYVGARIIEGVLLLAAAVSALVVLALARGNGDPTDVGLLLAVREQTYLLGSLVALGLGALVLYGLLLRTRMVPRWLPVWGLIGAVLILGRGLVEVYGVDLSAAVQGVLAAPIAINEMVLAVWLIVKGLDTPAPVAHERAPAPDVPLGSR
jgi:hypothetical protein